MHLFNDSIKWTFPDLDKESDISSLLTLDEIRELLKQNQKLTADISDKNNEIESLKLQISEFVFNQERLINLITEINHKVELALNENTQEIPILIKEMVQKICQLILGKKFKSNELNQVINTILNEFNSNKNIEVFLSKNNLDMIGNQPISGVIAYRLNNDLQDTEVVVSSGEKNFRFNLHETIDRLLG